MSTDLLRSNDAISRKCLSRKLLLRTRAAHWCAVGQQTCHMWVRARTCGSPALAMNKLSGGGHARTRTRAMGLKGTVPARAPRSENVVTGGPACGARADTCLRYLIFMSTREQGALGVIVCLALLPAPTRAACDPVVKIVSKSWKEDPMLKEWGRPGHSHCTQVYTNTNTHRCTCINSVCVHVCV